MRPDDAKRLHDDPNLLDAMQLLRERYHRDFENADADYDIGLKKIRLKFDIIRDFYSELQKVLNDEAIKASVTKVK